MIQRRHFISSIAAFCATSASLSKLASATTVSGGLNWHCDVIETVAHNKSLRHPVVTGVGLQPNGSLLAIVGDDHYVGLFDTKQGRYIHHLNGHTDWVRTSKFSPDGSQLATAGNDRELLIWNVGQWANPVITQRHPEAIINCAYSHDGRHLATVGFESTLRVYETQTGSLIQKFNCPCPDNHAIAYSGDSKFLAAGGRCGTVRVWDMTTAKVAAQFKAHKKRIRSIEFTPDGKIVSASDDRIVQVTDPSNPKMAKSLPRHASKLYSTAVLPNNMVAIGGSDNLIHVWDLNSLEEVGFLKGHTGTVSCLQYSTGKLVSGSFDTRVRLWRTESHTSVPVLQQSQLKNGWSTRIN
ncbi:MAG: WD40 repeat domain-containing protein [Mariniblastus sp.]|nr:WD40 repeat domain-containing protein [Mariniblastus sp.]